MRLLVTLIVASVFSVSDIVAMGRLREYAWTPAGRRNPHFVVVMMRIQSTIGKAVAVVAWCGFAMSVGEQGLRGAVLVSAQLTAIAGIWMALIGQHWLPSLWRSRRARRRKLLGRPIAFAGTLVPPPNVYYDKECTIHAEPGAMRVVSDASLPRNSGVAVVGAPKIEGLRKADLHDAPGRPAWWSLDIAVPGGSTVVTLSAAREYLELLTDLGPFDT
jgi:hypothetical protein